MIRIRCSPFAISVEGHAGYGECGKDIVCASVTTTLIILAKMMDAFWQDDRLMEPPEIDLKPGKGEISVVPELTYEEGVNAAFGIFTQVLGELAREYPDNVEVTISAVRRRAPL